MKKRIIIAAGAVLLAASAAVAVYVGKTRAVERMLFEANVEALMRSEGIGGHLCVPDIMESATSRSIWYCGTCSIVQSEDYVLKFCN